jgi:signal transduction histidine kinase
MSSPAKRSSSPGPDTIRRNYPLLLKRMERLMEVSRTLASTLDLNKLLRMIIQAAIELTDTEAASILLFDPRSGELRFEATTNIESAAMEGIVVPVESSIAGWIVTHSEPLVVPDTSKDSRWSQQVDQKIDFVTRSILGVPLITRDKTLGAVEALNKRAGSFTEEDITILQALSAQAAVAIVNARLFQQSDLISEMVHELRTPLMALTATSHLLLRPELPKDKHAELVGTLQRETTRLSQMTTDFLDMAKLESGRMRFTLEPFDLRQLAEECIEVVQPQAAARDIRIHLQTTSDLPGLESDRGKIKQVILNLLTNAVKYNREKGKITVNLNSLPAQCRVSVVDTGKGIPPDAMTHMFEKFYRVPDREGYSAGTGLGLPIAKKIVETLGGEIGVHSVVDEGTTFHFTLPVNPKKS